MSYNGDLYATSGADVVMSTKGDLVRFDSARERYGIGSANQILQVKSSLPSWQTVDLADTVLTTAGDVLIENATPELARLAAGTQYNNLQMGATLPAWSASSTSTMTAAQDILYSSSANTLARLAAGSDGDVLTTHSTGSAPTWETPASGSNVEILGQTDLSAQATEIEVLVTQSNIPDDYAFFRVIGGGDTTGSCNANWTLKSAGSYLSEYHQNSIQTKLGVGSDIYLGSDSVLELQSTAEINLARNFNFVIDINGNNATGVQWVWNMTGITGCVNLDHRTFSCGTAVTGASGLEFDGCKIALDNSQNFEAEGYMTVLGFKSA